MTTSSFLPKTIALAVGTIASVAIVGDAPQASAQTALFTSTVNVSGTNPLIPNPLATTTFTYNKTELSPQEFGYTLLALEASINTPLFARSYSLADLPTYGADIQALTGLIPTAYQSFVAPYLAALNNVINRTAGLPSNEFDYIGDGDFPPPTTTLTFTAADIPTPPTLLAPVVQTLFPAGGQISFSSTVGGVADGRPAVTLTPQSLTALLASEIPELPTTLPPELALLVPPTTELTTDVAAIAAPPPGDNTAAVPEPATLLGAGLAAGAAAIARRKKQAA